MIAMDEEITGHRAVELPIPQAKAPRKDGDVPGQSALGRAGDPDEGLAVRERAVTPVPEREVLVPRRACPVAVRPEQIHHLLAHRARLDLADRLPDAYEFRRHRSSDSRIKGTGSLMRQTSLRLPLPQLATNSRTARHPPPAPGGSPSASGERRSRASR